MKWKIKFQTNCIIWKNCWNYKYEPFAIFPHLTLLVEWPIRCMQCVHSIVKLYILWAYWSTLKIANDLPIFAFYYALLCICYYLSHLIGLFSVTWLSLLYKFTRFFIYFLHVSLWRRANARNVRLYYPYWQYTNLFIFRFVSLLCLRSTLRWFKILLIATVNKTKPHCIKLCCQYNELAPRSLMFTNDVCSLHMSSFAYQLRLRPRTHGNVFLRFCIVSSDELVVLDSLGNSKQYKNAGKRFRVYGA